MNGLGPIDAAREFHAAQTMAALDADLQTESAAYTNLMTFVRTREALMADNFAWGYLAEAVRTRSLEDIQAIERGLTRALREIRP